MPNGAEPGASATELVEPHHGVVCCKVVDVIERDAVGRFQCGMNRVLAQLPEAGAEETTSFRVEARDQLSTFSLVPGLSVLLRQAGALRVARIIEPGPPQNALVLRDRAHHDCGRGIAESDAMRT